ncbi:nucleotide exchange factor GrpE [Pseudaeromonas pectinilytica]|jgi:Molecular chaperone GrpE (heat shock protein)|nr:nucleotide exchange factor GrpE [Aeromonadaceae bacterium]MBP8126740.1 nucleotide exchange factor GrpE [Aeromonadaceae bacterium]
MSNQEQAMEQSAEQNTEALLDAELADAGTGSTASDELTALLEKLAQAEAAAQEEKDRALRIAAEMENLRRRSALDVEKAHKFALEKFSGELLPVIDSLERALELSDRENEALKPTLEGVDLTLRSMLSTVAKFGVEAINPLGEPFDPNRHQAISMVENGQVAPNSVIAVMQKGYELNGRIIRPAMVMVARAPSVDVQA